MYDGKSTYKLNVPKDTPAKDFWSVIVYTMETKTSVMLNAWDSHPAMRRPCR